MKRLLLVAVTAATACGAPARPVNDPANAHSFFCTKSDTSPDRDVCFVEDVDACRSTVLVAKSEGVFMSECVAQPWAWCAVGTQHGQRRFVCAAEEAGCARRRDLDLEAERDPPACVRKTTGVADTKLSR